MSSLLVSGRGMIARISDFVLDWLHGGRLNSLLRLLASVALCLTVGALAAESSEQSRTGVIYKCVSAQYAVQFTNTKCRDGWTSSDDRSGFSPAMLTRCTPRGMRAESGRAMTTHGKGLL